MQVFICVDDKNGMMFNKRRQSKDRFLIDKVHDIIGNKCLWVSTYTKQLFPDATICEDFSKIDGFAFIEDPADLPEIEINTLYVFRWNRHYPSDKKLNLDLSLFELINVEEFKGYSHDNITLETYSKKGTTEVQHETK